jgi:hypothetical protein
LRADENGEFPFPYSCRCRASRASGSFLLDVDAVLLVETGCSGSLAALRPARERHERVRQIADAAQSLKQSAIALSGHPPGKLEIPDRARFAVLARSLADRAGELEEAAARDDADAVEISRKRLGAACRDCHSRFRPDSPGVPDAFR